MRLINLILVLLLVLLQFKLWFGHGGLRDVSNLRQSLHTSQANNAELEARNNRLAADVLDLKDGTEAIEERARNDLGLVAADEEFYQVVDRPGI